MEKNEFIEYWYEHAETTRPDAPVGSRSSGHTRSFWNVCGVAFFDDTVMPYRAFKKQRYWLSLDVNLSQEHARYLADTYHGTAVGCPYGDGWYVRLDERKEIDVFRVALEYVFDRIHKRWLEFLPVPPYEGGEAQCCS